MVLRSLSLKRKLQKHTSNSAGKSVTAWNVAGVHNEGITLRVAQKLYTDYNNKRHRNDCLETILHKLSDSELIRYALRSGLHISGMSRSRLPDEADPKDSDFFTDGLNYGTSISLIITQDRIIIFDGNAETKGDIVKVINYESIEEVFYGYSPHSTFDNAGSSDLQINIDDQRFYFHYSGVLYQKPDEIQDAAQYIPERSDLAYDYKVEGSINTSDECFDEGWGNIKREWEEDDQTATEREVDTNHDELSRDRSSQIQESWQNHIEASNRKPTVQKGEVVNLGVLDIRHHHSGERVAFGKYENFSIFVKDIPQEVQSGSIVRTKVMDIHSNGKSATGLYLDVVDM